MSERKVLDMRVGGSQLKRPGHPRVPLPKVFDLLAKAARSYCSVEGGATLREALELMAQQHREAIVVTDDAHLLGVLSETDCSRIFIQGPTADRVLVREVTPQYSAAASPDDSLYSCLYAMNENHARYLPVLGGEIVVGLVSREQVLNELVIYFERVFHEYELDQQIVFLRGTYSC